MKILTLAVTLTLSSMLSPVAMAQDKGADRYEEPKRFPVLRKAFRQIRSDVRYHAKALHETASGIRHDLEATIIGESDSQRQNQYGYRGEAPRRPQYDDPQGRFGEDYYEEPRAPRRGVDRPSPRPPVGIAPGVLPDVAPRREPDPQIVAPRKTPAPAPTKRQDPKPAAEKPSPKPQPEVLPKPESKPAPPQPGAKPKEDSKPVVGKVEYPYAKRSDRPGFHYSPYEPYELLDTQGIEAGALAKDPGNGKIFRIPK